MNSKLIITYVISKEIKNEDLDKIVMLKMQHWIYTKESHLAWIKKNIRGHEHHLMIKNEQDILVAYLNIVNLNIIIDGIIKIYSGVGNVCVDKNYTGYGYGHLVMNSANLYLKRQDHHGVLLCKENLVKFYLKAGWHKYQGQTILNNQPYFDAVLFTHKTTSKMVQIDRIF